MQGIRQGKGEIPASAISSHGRGGIYGKEIRYKRGDGTMKIKFCPDLTGKEEVKAALIGHGDFVRPILNVCIKEKCVAYRNGYCKKYENEVEEY